MTIEEFEAELATMRTNARQCQESVQLYWRTGTRASLEEIVQYANAASQSAARCEDWHR